MLPGTTGLDDVLKDLEAELCDMNSRAAALDGALTTSSATVVALTEARSTLALEQRDLRAAIDRLHRYGALAHMQADAARRDKVRLVGGAG